MGIDIETHRCRIGTFRQGGGADVCTLEVVINLSNPFKPIGAVLFIGTLLLMAGIESNPGPKNEDGPPKPVGPLNVYDVTENTVTLSWQRPSDVGKFPLTGFLIERKHAESLHWVEIAYIRPVLTSVVADDLIEENDYLFRVRAVSANEKSEPLETETVTTMKRKIDTSIEAQATPEQTVHGVTGMEEEMSSKTKATSIEPQTTPEQTVTAGMEDEMSSKTKDTSTHPDATAGETEQGKIDLKCPMSSNDTSIGPQATSEETVHGVTGMEEVISSKDTSTHPDATEGETEQGKIDLKCPMSSNDTSIGPQATSEETVHGVTGMEEVISSKDTSTHPDATEGETEQGKIDLKCPMSSNDTSIGPQATSEETVHGVTGMEEVISSKDTSTHPDATEGETEQGKIDLKCPMSSNDTSIGPQATSEETVHGVTGMEEVISSKDTSTHPDATAGETGQGEIDLTCRMSSNDVPSKPVGPLFANKLSENSVLLAWQQPAEDNDSPLTAYVVEYKQTAHSNWKEIARICPPNTVCVANGLDNGLAFFRVKAVNAEGHSEPLETDQEILIGKAIVTPSIPGGPIEISTIERTSATLTWKPSDNDGGAPIKEYILEAKEASKSSWTKVAKVKPDNTTYCVKNLKDKQDYVFRVCAENEVGRSDALVSDTVTLKSPFDVPSKPIGPLQVDKATEYSISLSWQPPVEDGGSPLTGYKIECRQTSTSTWNKCGTSCQPETSFKVNALGEDYHFRVKAANSEGESEALETMHTVPMGKWINESWNLLETLELGENYPNKITMKDYLAIDQPSKNETIKHADLPWLLLKKILLAHSDSRDKIMAEALDRSKTEVPLSPVDIFNIVIQCCDPFVKAMVYKKLYLCKIALPFHSRCAYLEGKMVSAWPLRSIVMEQNGKEYNALQLPTCTLSFVRIGRPNFSKSKLMNNLMSTNGFNTFFNRDCHYGNKKRPVSKGSTDLFWLFSESNEIIKTLFNLRGDLRIDFDDTDRQFLQQMTDILCIFVELDDIIEHFNFINRMTKQFNRMILIVNNPKGGLHKHEEHVHRLRNKTTKVVLTYEDKQEISQVDLINVIQNIMAQYNVENCSLETRLSSVQCILVDENIERQTRAKDMTNCIFKKIKEAAGTSNIKKAITPAQNIHSKKLGIFRRELDRSTIKEQEDLKKDIKTQMECQIAEMSYVVKEFAKNLIEMHSASSAELQHFLSWMSVYLDVNTRELLPTLISKNKKDFEHLWEMKTKRVENTLIIEAQEQVNNSSRSIDNTLFSVQDLFRELIHIQEACLQTKTLSETVGLPNTDTMADMFANLIVLGYPFELLNGEDNYMPFSFIEKVLGKVHFKINKEKVFAVSILGLQSSGKSTLLNTMFGSQFPVSAGQCTRGVHIQLIPMNIKMDMPFKYVLLIDTEGLRAPELGDRNCRHDNELATFATGLGDITILNIMGENKSEIAEMLQIVVHAFLRLKLTNPCIDINKKCIFVHHNVADKSASEKMDQGLQNITRTLDEKTKEAAESEGISSIDSFNQVIHFEIREDIWYFPNLWHGNPPFARINEKYSEQILELRLDLINMAISTRGKSYKSLEDTLIHINDLWKGVTKESFVFAFRNTLEIKAYCWLEKKLQAILWEARDSFLIAVEKEKNVAASRLTDVNMLIDQKSYIQKRMSELFEESKSQTKEKCGKLFEDNDFPEIISVWRKQTYIKLNVFWEEQKSQARLQIEMKFNRREVELKTASMFKEYEADLYEMSKSLVKDIHDGEIEPQAIEDKFEKMWSTFENNLPKESDSTHSIEQKFEYVLGEILHKNVTLLNTRMFEVKWPFWNSSITLTLDLKQKLFTIEDLSPTSMVTHLKNNIKKKLLNRTKDQRYYDLNQIIHLVNSLLTSLETIVEHKCQTDCEITDQHIKELLNKVDAWMTDMWKDKHNLGVTLTSTFRVKLFVHVASYASNMFTAQNKKCERERGLTAHIRKCKNETKVRFYAMIEKRSTAHGAAKVFISALCEFASQTVKDGMCTKILNRIYQCLPRVKYNMMIEIVTDLAKTGTFKDWISYIGSAENYARRWLREQSELHIFGTQPNTYSRISLQELEQFFDAATQALKESLERDVVKQGIQTDKWIELFLQSMKTFPISPEIFSNVKLGFEEIPPETSNEFLTLLLETLAIFKDKVVQELSATTAENVRWSSTNPYDEAFKHIWGCTKTCPFCAETCAKDLLHNTNHYCIQHRPSGCIGTRWIESQEILLESCNFSVQSSSTHTCGVFQFSCNGSKNEKCSDGLHKYRDYKTFVPDWDIAPNACMEDTSKIWLWFMSTYREQLGEHYGIVVTNIPDSWTEITKEDAIKSYGSVMTS